MAMITSCFFKGAPSSVIIISPGMNSNVFSNEILFKWKLGNLALNTSYDLYFGEDLNNLELIKSNIGIVDTIL